MISTPLHRRRPIARPFAAVLGSAVMLIALPVAAATGDLALERVMLSTGGVGYFEFGAEIEGDAELSLTVPLDQVDDVLKSIVVYDDAGGVGHVRLPGREPLAQIFRDLPFGPSALDSPVALLNSLQGSVVRTSGSRAVEGRIIKVTAEPVALPDGGGTTMRHRVSVMTAQGLQQFILEQAEAIEFADPEVSAQVSRALAAIATHRVRDSRTLSVVTRGTTRRAVRVGYVIAVPLWKASYRLTLPPAGEKGTARLRGWAHVDNLSGQDWSAVDLTLVSGNPVTFHQALYAAYFVDRPEAPVEVLGRVLPRLDQGAVASAEAFGERERGGARLDELRRGGESIPETMARSEFRKSMSAAEADLQSRIAGGAGVAAAPAPALAAQEPATLIAATAEEAATQVVFRVPTPVTVANGQSLMIPIADRTVPGQRIALYQPTAHPLHPLASVRLDNDSESGLPPGSLTLYESADAGTAAYVGDARLPVLPAGDRRMVSFALDQKVRISRETKGLQRILKGRISKGVLELTYSHQQSTVYRLKGAAREPRRVVIEHPLQDGWTLVAPKPEDVERGESHYRVPTSLAADGEATVEVTLQRPRVQRIELISLPQEQLVALAGNGEVEPSLRRAFVRLGDLRQIVDLKQRQLDQLTQARGRIFEEQKRIRDNLARIPSNSDLQRRYLQKLNEQEDELERLNAAMAAAQAELNQARDALTQYIADLEI